MSEDEVRAELRELMRDLGTMARKPMLPHEFTAMQFAKQEGITYQQATRLLNKLEEVGTLSSRDAIDPATQHQVKAYSRKETE